MKKRIISLTTSMAMVSSLFVALPINTYAADSIDGIYAESLTSSAVAIGDTFTIGSLTYEVIADNEVEVSDCDYATSGAIDIPACVSYGENDFNVTSIGDKAFEGCSSLTSVTIPNSVTSIGDDAFEGCFDLTSINVDKDNTIYSSIDGVLYDKVKTQLIRCPRAKTSVTIPNGITSIGDSAFWCHNNLTSVTIPDSVTNIGNSAFFGCLNLTSVTIPNGVTSIGDEAFAYCSSLTSVTIPNSITSIADKAFAYCSRLTSVTIPNSVTSIGDDAFEGCSSLTSVTIPNSVTSIGDDAFEGCFDLTSINVDKDNTVYSSIDGVLYDKAKTQLIRCPGAKTSVTIPNSITSIADKAFAYCSRLTSVTIPNSVTSIGDDAFEGCSSLTSVTIPNSVTSIGDEAFAYCSSLTSVTIPNSVTSIGDSAFVRCFNLTSVTIPNSVTSIGDYAFGGCLNLTSVTISNSVTSIGNSAFSDCSSLTDVYYTGTQEEWNKISFGSYNDVLENSTIHYHTHKFTSWTTTKPATCTSTGTQARKCSACGKTETKVIPKLAHRYTATAVKPTYAAKGYTLHKCSVCGTSYKDNYTAKKTVPTVSVKSSYTYAPDAVRINWNKVSGASGYKIFRYNTATKKWQVVGRIFNNSTFNFRNSGLKPGTAYKYSVQAFVKENGRYFYGKCSPYIYTATKPSSTKITKNTYAPDAVRLYWNKVSCSGYKIQKYNSATKTWTTIKKVPGSATNYRISGLRRNTAYKFRIQPYKAAGAGKYSYGTVSASYTARTSK